MADEATQTTAPEGQQQAATQTTEPKTLQITQEQFDRTIKERLERQRQQFSDYDDLKQKAAKLAEIESSRQSEAEKLVSAIEKANQQAQQATEREKAALEKASTTLIRAAVISEASRQKAIDPDAVYALLDKSQVTLGDDDRVSGLEDAVKALLAERSYLVGGRPNGGFDGGARENAPTGNSRADLNDRLRSEWLSKQHHM